MKEWKKRGELWNRLYEYEKSDYYPFHMPGHKRNMRFMEPMYRFDITEIEGFDNLHHAGEILKEIQERMAAYFSSGESHMLINGSTAGILAAVSGAVEQGGKLLMARNCHKAVYHAALLRDLKCRYLYPEYIPMPGINGGIRPDQVREALEQEKDIKAVILTSPTYEGLVSDIEAIAGIVHEANALLIVDEAHGAHFGSGTCFPKRALSLGADVVIESLHKTLPAPTQTAVIHIAAGCPAAPRIRKYLEIYQTSSPSYLLMAAMEECIAIMEEEGEELLFELRKMADHLLEQGRERKRIGLLSPSVTGSAGIFDFDRSRIVIYDKEGRISGKTLYQILLEKYHLQLEMAQEGYALAMLTVGDTWEGIFRLERALDEIDLRICEETDEVRSLPEDVILPAENKIVYTMAKTEVLDKERMLLNEAAGRISGEFVFLYPPGIPLLVPGEEISRELIGKIDQYREEGFELQGLSDPEGKQIWVCLG